MTSCEITGEIKSNKSFLKRRPEVVTSAYFIIRPIILAVIFQNSFVEARKIILKVSTIQRLMYLCEKHLKSCCLWRRGRVDDFRIGGYLKLSRAMPQCRHETRYENLNALPASMSNC